MLNKYRLFQRANGIFYWQDNESGKQGSLRTKDRSTKAATRQKRGSSFADTKSHNGARLSSRTRREDEHAHVAGRHARDGHSRSPMQSGALRAYLLLQSVRFDPQQAARPDHGGGPPGNCAQQRQFRRTLPAPPSQPRLRHRVVGVADPSQAGLAEDSEQASPGRDSARTRGDYRERKESRETRLLRTA